LWADLLAGAKLSELAERRQLSKETLRSQLKSLLQKTGATRQSELMRSAASSFQGQTRSCRDWGSPDRV